MTKYSLFTIIKTLQQNKAATLINILGLSLSIACGIFVYAFIHHERSFDGFHTNSDRTYRLVSDIKTSDGQVYEGNSSFAAAKSLRSDYPQLKSVTQIYIDGQASLTVKKGKNTSEKFVEKGLAYADEYFLKVFDFPAIARSGTTMLSDANEVILTKKLADKYFNPIGDYSRLLGRTVEVNNKPYKISAILRDIPFNTNVHFNVLLSIKAFENMNKGISSDWKASSRTSYTFVTLSESDNVQWLEKSLISFRNKYLDAEQVKKVSFHLQPIKEIHTDHKYGGTIYTSPKVLIIGFSVLGIIVLITACINFVNLATAQALKRAKEVAIRKTLGCSKAELVGGFLTETLFVVFIAALLGLLIAYQFIQQFNKYISAVIDSGITLDSSVFFFLLDLILIVSLSAGFYPAKMLANFQAAEVLRSAVHGRRKGIVRRFSLRKALVAVQFIVSQILLIGTIVVAIQIDHVNTIDLGYRKEGLFALEMPKIKPAKLEMFRNELAKLPEVQDVSFSSSLPVANNTFLSDVRLPSSPVDDKFLCERKFVDPHFLSTYGLTLLEGRNLSNSDSLSISKHKEKSKYNMLLNQKAITILGFKSPREVIGKLILVGEKEQATVVGVVKDFFNVTPNDEIKPCMMIYATNTGGVASIRFNTDTPSEATLSNIRKNWEEIYPDGVYQAVTLQEFMQRRASFVIQDILFKAFKIFVILSIVIGCVGLYGLISYMVIQREMEIGVRKVLGSSVRQIVGLFSREFAKLVIMAFLISAPIAYIVMNMWLQTFAHRISIRPEYLISALIISILIAAFTISSQIFRAAFINPVNSLRKES